MSGYVHAQASTSSAPAPAPLASDPSTSSAGSSQPLPAWTQQQPPEARNALLVLDATGPVRFMFSKTERENEMLILPDETDWNSRPLYHITLQTSPLRPFFATTVVRREGNAYGPLVGHFEMGLQNGIVHGSILGLKYTLLKPVTTYGSNGLKFKWIPMGRPPLRWTWPGLLSNKVHYTCTYDADRTQTIATFHPVAFDPPVNFNREHPVDHIVIEVAGLGVMDDIILSALIFERMITNRRNTIF